MPEPTFSEATSADERLLYASVGECDTPEGVFTKVQWLPPPVGFENTVSWFKIRCVFGPLDSKGSELDIPGLAG
eukprot:6892528-Alexandrium_andersonii.AAC.1